MFKNYTDTINERRRLEEVYYDTLPRTNKDLFPNSTIVKFTNGFIKCEGNDEEEYFQGYKTLPDTKLQEGAVSLNSNGIDIPFKGKILRITVSEWGSVELIDDPNYIDHLDRLRLY